MSSTKKKNMVWDVFVNFYLKDSSRIQNIKEYKSATIINRFWRKASGFFPKKYELCKANNCKKRDLNFNLIQYSRSCSCSENVPCRFSPIRFSSRPWPLKCCGSISDNNMWRYLTSNNKTSYIKYLLSTDNISHKLRFWFSRYLTKKLLST